MPNNVITIIGPPTDIQMGKQLNHIPMIKNNICAFHDHQSGGGTEMQPYLGDQILVKTTFSFCSVTMLVDHYHIVHGVMMT